MAAVVGEALLYGSMVLFDHGGTFTDGTGLAMLFHIPGIVISWWLFGRYGFSEAVATAFIIFSGAIQFFVIAWIAIKLWRKT